MIRHPPLPIDLQIAPPPASLRESACNSHLFISREKGKGRRATAEPFLLTHFSLLTSPFALPPAACSLPPGCGTIEELHTYNRDIRETNILQSKDPDCQNTHNPHISINAKKRPPFSPRRIALLPSFPPSTLSKYRLATEEEKGGRREKRSVGLARKKTGYRGQKGNRKGERGPRSKRKKAIAGGREKEEAICHTSWHPGCLSPPLSRGEGRATAHNNHFDYPC